MLILITTVGILVFVYSDDYMSHDEGMEQKCSHCAIRNVAGKNNRYTECIYESHYIKEVSSCDMPFRCAVKVRQES
jgi:hypothetical protein